jgi:hypothetical protein
MWLNKMQCYKMLRINRKKEKMWHKTTTTFFEKTLLLQCERNVWCVHAFTMCRLAIASRQMWNVLCTPVIILKCWSEGINNTGDSNTSGEDFLCCRSIQSLCLTSTRHSVWFGCLPVYVTFDLWRRCFFKIHVPLLH